MNPIFLIATVFMRFVSLLCLVHAIKQDVDWWMTLLLGAVLWSFANRLEFWFYLKF